jgi:hypothetical protein
MRRVTVILLALTALVSGCGGGGIRHDLAATADNLGKIRAGAIAFSMLVTPRSAIAHNPFGFEVKGPFRFAAVPTAHVTYTQIANGHQATATLVLDQSGGRATSNGTRRTLSSAQVRQLRAAAASVHSGSSFDVGSWIKTVSQCGPRCARGDLDVAAAANTLLSLAGSTATLTADEAKQLAQATRKATYELTWTPAHLVRDLKVHVDLGFAAPPRLQAALGKLVGASFDLHLGLTNPEAA